MSLMGRTNYRNAGKPYMLGDLEGKGQAVNTVVEPGVELRKSARKGRFPHGGKEGAGVQFTLAAEMRRLFRIP
jgi:hypothetical protein